MSNSGRPVIGNYTLSDWVKLAAQGGTRIWYYKLGQQSMVGNS